MKYFLFLLFVSSPLHAMEPMEFVYSDPYPPFSWQGEKRMQGVLIDIVTEAVQERMNIPVRHRGYPWKRAQSLVKKGFADAFITTPSPARRKYTNISSEIIFKLPVNLFVSKDHPKFQQLIKVKSIDELKNYQMVSNIGNGWAKKNLEDRGIFTHYIAYRSQIPKFLILGRADGWIDTFLSAEYFVKKEGAAGTIVRAPHIFSNYNQHICIGKHSAYKDILAQFDGIVREMKNDGTIQKIIEKYIRSSL